MQIINWWETLFGFRLNCVNECECVCVFLFVWRLFISKKHIWTYATNFASRENDSMQMLSAHSKDDGNESTAQHSTTQHYTRQINNRINQTNKSFILRKWVWKRDKCFTSPQFEEHHLHFEMWKTPKKQSRELAIARNGAHSTEAREKAHKYHQCVCCSVFAFVRTFFFCKFSKI